MLNDKDIKKVLSLLDKEYGKNPVCYLNYKKDYELLFATILAAQCKDARVNEVTAIMFKENKTLEQFSKLSVKQIENYIKSLGLYKSKAIAIKESAIKLIEEFGGKVPSEMEKLTNLNGVGRKTANVIRTHIYKIPSIVVDTHVKRTSYLIGLTKEFTPEKIEYDLMKHLPEENWSRINSQLMALGRTFCNAKKKKCYECFLRDICEKNVK